MKYFPLVPILLDLISPSGSFTTRKFNVHHTYARYMLKEKIALDALKDLKLKYVDKDERVAALFISL
tara:strand:- start:50 stop:250 length:201 start_codon:yes stop_codon:yes gene_type:complete